MHLGNWERRGYFWAQSLCFLPQWHIFSGFVEGLPYLQQMCINFQWLPMLLVLLWSFYLDFLWHDYLLVERELELELELLAGHGLIAWLLLPRAGKSYPLCWGTCCEQCCLIFLPSIRQSDPLGGGASCGRFLLPCQTIGACEIWIPYLSVDKIDYLREDHPRFQFLQHIPHLLVIQTSWSHCFHAESQCVHCCLRRR